MAEPTKKSPEMEKAIDAFNPSGRKRMDSIKSDTIATNSSNFSLFLICSWCGKPATKFKDALSRKEYSISGLCQDCQDKTFEESDEEDEDES